MKKIPMILLLLVPYVILIICYQTNLDFSIALYIYGILMAFNMVYAFMMPKLGFNGKQILFWNLLLKLFNIPLVLLIVLVTLVTTLIGGETISDEAVLMVIIAFLSCYVIQLSSAMFGFSGFLCYRKQGTLSKVGVLASSIAQLIPMIDILGSIICYCMLRKK